MKPYLLLLGLSAALAPAARAQSFCSSDGQTAPAALVERFISADCEACWRAQPAPEPSPGTLILDWIVPSAAGDDAPLSAAASRDASLRLESLGRRAPDTSFITRREVLDGPADQNEQALRVAQGVVVGDYIGVSIEFKNAPPTAPKDALTAWLVLVENISAGTEGTPVERHLVRNVFLSTWSSHDQASPTDPFTYREMRPLSIPPGSTPARLRVLGWVQDDRGRVLGAAKSVCAAHI